MAGLFEAGDAAPVAAMRMKGLEPPRAMKPTGT
jgi:hypothetical protein